MINYHPENKRIYVDSPPIMDLHQCLNNSERYWEVLRGRGYFSRNHEHLRRWDKSNIFSTVDFSVRGVYKQSVNLIFKSPNTGQNNNYDESYSLQFQIANKIDRLQITGSKYSTINPIISGMNEIKNAKSTMKGFYYDEVTNIGLAKTMYMSRYNSVSTFYDVLIENKLSVTQHFKLLRDIISTMNRLGFERGFRRDENIFFMHPKIGIAFLLGYSENSLAVTVFVNIQVSLSDYIRYIRTVKSIKPKEPESKPVEYHINVISQEGNRFSIRKVGISPESWNLGFDIRDHYNESTCAFYESLKTDIRKGKHGLAIMQSKPGCGKTFLLRKMINDIPEINFIFIPPHLIGILNDPNFFTFAMEHLKEKVVIVEDAETVLAKRSDMSGASVSTILNISNGMMGDILNITFLFTINCDFSQIDEALLRKGRLLQKEELKPLDTSKSNRLLAQLGVDYTTDKPMTLADIYNFGQKDHIGAEKRTIGFNKQ